MSIQWRQNDTLANTFGIARVLALVGCDDDGEVQMLIQWYDSADTPAIKVSEGIPYLQTVSPVQWAELQPISCCFGIGHVFRVPSDNSDDLVFIRDSCYECLQGINL